MSVASIDELRLRVAQLERWCCMTTTERLLEYLLELSTPDPEAGWLGTSVPAARSGSQASMGEQIFCAREQVVHVVTRLEKAGVVWRKKRGPHVVGYGIDVVRARELLAAVDARRQRYQRPGG